MSDNRNLLDESEAFQELCEACRRGDVRAVQSLISVRNVDINHVDKFDYPPLTLASLCGHYEVVQLLLESGAKLERDTFAGERTLYNALNNSIRNLLLKYDYSKSNDPLQPWASGFSALLTAPPFDTTDVTLRAVSARPPFIQEFRLHKFILSARSPYFYRKFAKAYERSDAKGASDFVNHVKLSSSVDSRAFETALQFLYLCDVTEVREEVLENLAKLASHMEHPEILEQVLVDDAKQRRQKHREAVEAAQIQFDEFFNRDVISRRIVIPQGLDPETIRIPQNNPSFADVSILAELGPLQTLYPVHRAVLRSEFFTTMFTSNFREAQRPSPEDPHALLPIIPLEATPEVTELLLRFFYSGKLPTIPLEHVLDLLYLADALFVDRLKTQCAQVTSTAGNMDDPPFTIYEVIRAGWMCRMRRLEDFGARYIAERLEDYLQNEFKELSELVAESAQRIKERQETDTIELVDDIRYYLDQRFRLRMDELGGEEMYDEGAKEKAVRKENESDRNGGKTSTVIWGQNAADEEEEDSFGNEGRQYEHLLSSIDRLLDKIKLEA